MTFLRPTSEHVAALLDPLAVMDGWTNHALAMKSLNEVASLAVDKRNHSLWWNYIYLHEQYVERFSPLPQDILPGFPDMDTAVALGAPTVYNWYYHHKGIPPVLWTGESFADACVSVRAGFLDPHNPAIPFPNETSMRDTDARMKTAPPLWAVAAFAKTSHWGRVLSHLHREDVQPVGVGPIDRHAVEPCIVWQWQCLAQKDIGFLPEEDAMRALDALRQSDISEHLRTRCESHFLDYYPQCKAVASIAFSLGGPLWSPAVQAFETPLAPGLFDASPEALHPK